MLSISKPKSLVGLDVESGSIAAAELQVNGRTTLAGWGTMERRGFKRRAATA